MPPSLWDPDKILQVTKGPNGGMFCLGRARFRYDSRCRWDIPWSDYRAVCAILKDMAMVLPHNISDISTTQLRILARLGLCEHHVDQVGEVVAGWEEILGSVEDIYWTYKEQVGKNGEKLDRLRADVKKCRRLIGANAENDLSMVLGRYTSQQKKELATARTTISKLQQDQAATKHSLVQAQEESKQYQQREQKQMAGCDELREKNVALETEVKLAKQDCHDLQNQRESLSSELADTSAELRQVRDVNQRIENDNKSLQLEVKAKNEQIKTLRDSDLFISTQLKGTSERLEEVEKELLATRQTNTALQDELDTTIRENTHIRSELNQLYTQRPTGIYNRVKQWIQKTLRILKKGHKDSDEERVELAQAGD
ncbi:hypothetical protein ASPWEDRAFT_41493 [Aspergillus wentii DTO 134E9]|uniref:Uncharacterized protein n=1 Tax=Aspergillus wentii DTO 134E9 TaxID=1073089 RepID=A0A1L9RFG1_ASPWE|nr:uncharacterized protein ASPWEDRAFT_41493 [Aspergillus wentii DTO 134E9]KAI9925413.1 hypothetical protein MW887_005794 [Aspergillus wentii]OJJ33644.1 hypothetical protein ASPWEDRAFT_41493 [Aspergillus wentii DTO 134E9]